MRNLLDLWCTCREVSLSGEELTCVAIDSSNTWWLKWFETMLKPDIVPLRQPGLLMPQDPFAQVPYSGPWIQE